MRGVAMTDGPGPLGSFLWLWIAMSAAMMLPSLVPAASLATSVGRSGSAFASGYFVLWTVTGVVAFEAARSLMGAGRWLAAGAIAAAALYQLSPLKSACAAAEARSARYCSGARSQPGSSTASPASAVAGR